MPLLQKFINLSLVHIFYILKVQSQFFRFFCFLSIHLQNGIVSLIQILEQYCPVIIKFSPQRFLLFSVIHFLFNIRYNPFYAVKTTLVTIHLLFYCKNNSSCLKVCCCCSLHGFTLVIVTFKFILK